MISVQIQVLVTQPILELRKIEDGVIQPEDVEILDEEDSPELVEKTLDAN